MVNLVRVRSPGQFGVRQTWGDTVDTNVERRKRFRTVAGERIQGRFGRRVVNHLRLNYHAGDRRDVDDPPELSFDHFILNRPGGQKRSVHVDFKHPLPVIEIQVLMRCG